MQRVSFEGRRRTCSDWAADEVENIASRGGALISAIYSHTSHGDPFIRNLTREVLKEASPTQRGVDVSC